MVPAALCLAQPGASSLSATPRTISLTHSLVFAYIVPVFSFEGELGHLGVSDDLPLFDPLTVSLQLAPIFKAKTESTGNRMTHPSSRVAWMVLLTFAAVLSPPSTRSAPQATATPDRPTNWRTAVSEMPPEPPDDADRALRHERNAVFDDQSRMKPSLDEEPDPHVGHGMSIYHTRIDLLPSSLSDAVVVGTVIAFQPYFSNDRTTIYTELRVQVEKVLKDKAHAVGDQVAIDELGGAIRLPSGRVASHISAPLDSEIDVAKRYVLFLAYSDVTKTFSVVKAWELRGGRAQPVAKSDLTSDNLHDTQRYSGMPEADFLIAVQRSSTSTAD